MARVRKQPTGGPPQAPSELTTDERGKSIPESIVNSSTSDMALIDAIEKSDAEQSSSIARDFLRGNVPGEKPIDARFPGMVERTFKPIDWNAAFDRFEGWLRMGNNRTQEAHIRKAHEEGIEVALLMLDTSLQVRFAREAWEVENDVMLGGMRDEASKYLEREKDRKIRTKTITEADIAQKCASLFPDEWAAQEKKRLQYKLTEKRATECYELATTRCRMLDSMMARLR